MTAVTTAAGPSVSKPSLWARITDRWVIKLLIILIVIVWVIPTLGVLISSFRSAGDVNATGWWTVFTRPLEGTGSVLVLATDGISDVKGNSGTGMTVPPHRLGGWIARRVRQASREREIDDIGAMALTAGAMDDTAGEILIMGGTQPAVETAFGRLDGQATALDRWRPIKAWKSCPDLLATAGIRIV